MKIMVGYDGSNASWDALILAQKHAEAFGAKVYVLTSMFGGENSDRKDVEKAEYNLEYAKNLLKEGGTSCETHLLIRGLSPGEDLIKFARENEIDEIIIGLVKRSKMQKLVFGSTAQYVILNAPCPVATIK